jgi:hypothetical protein|tara:strand:+ start:210 stop:746 length:537 start_codon:yes stop_codon:yes gene_type:complete
MNLKLIIVALALFVSACSNTINDGEKVQKLYLDKKTVAPKWFQKYPADDKGMIYAVATGLSEDMQLSVDKAMHDAKVELADKMYHKINADFKRFITDSGNITSGNTVQETTKISQNVIAQVMVSGYKVINKQIINIDGQFRTFVLLEYNTELFEAPRDVAVVDKHAIADTISNSDVIQ